MRGLLLFALSFANLNDIWSPDVIPNALLPFTLLRQGNVDFDEFTAPVEADGFWARDAYFFRACGESTATEPPISKRSRGGPPAPGPNDRVCSVFPPGMGFLALPFFAPAIVTGAQATDRALLIRVGHLAAAFYETLAALLLWAVLRRIASERASLMLVLLYFLGTSVRTIAAQALWQHAGVHLAVAVALWILIRERPLSRAAAFVSGLALGLGGVVRQTTALVAIGQSPRRMAWSAIATVFAGVAVGVIPLLAYNAVAFGSALEQGYGIKPFGGDTLRGLFGLLFSPSRGLFVYEPWAVLALAGFVIARFANTTAGFISARVSALIYPWLALLALYAMYEEWWGGRVFGPRFLDDAAPLLIVGLAWAVNGGWFAFGPMRVLLWISAAWSLLIFNAAAFVYDQKWDTVPVNVNDDPSKLFSWADPQWLAVLRSLPDGGAKAVVAVVLTLLALAFLFRVEGLLGGRRIASQR